MALGSLLDAGADLDRGARDCSIGCRCAAGRSRSSPCCAAGSRRPTSTCGADEDGVVRTFVAHPRPHRGSPPARPCRDRAAGARSRCSPRSKGRLHRPARRRRCTSTRSAASTRSSTWSAPSPRSSCSASTTSSASPVAIGTGMVRTAHGVFPNPPPAVVELLRGAPTYGIDAAVELTTPTGAALLAALARGFGPLPPMTISGEGLRRRDRATSTGAQRDPGRPRCRSRRPTERGQPVVLLETNVDDATGETLAHAVDGAARRRRARRVDHADRDEEGPARPHGERAVRPGDGRSSRRRAHRGDRVVRRPRLRLERWPAMPLVEEVDVDGRPMRVKVSPGRAKAEHDDARRAARRIGMPVREVTRAGRSTRGTSPTPTTATRPAEQQTVGGCYWRTSRSSVRRCRRVWDRPGARRCGP